MQKAFILLLFIFTLVRTSNAQVMTVPVIDFQDFQTLSNHNSDTLYIVNFWATWCKPCVEEMPGFQSIAAKYASKKVKVLFISLDFKSKLESVTKFVQDKKIKNPVYLLSAGNPNDWIDKVDPSWSGAIPATVFYKKGKKVEFHEGELNQEQLETIIKKQIP